MTASINKTLLGCWTMQSGRTLPVVSDALNASIIRLSVNFYQMTQHNISVENDFSLISLFQLKDHKDINEEENDHEW
jgi:hypothetical protein